MPFQPDFSDGKGAFFASLADHQQSCVTVYFQSNSWLNNSYQRDVFRSRIRMHIRAYLFTLAAGILLPVVLFSGIALRMLQHAEKEAALGGLAETANGVALLVDRELYSAQAALRVLAASPSLAARDYAAYYQQARHAHGADQGWSLLVGADGRQLVNTAAPFDAAPAARALPDVAEIIRGGRTVVSDLLPPEADGKRHVTVSMPVALPDGSHVVLVKVLASDYFVTLVQGGRVAPGWLVALIDSRGNFVARNMRPAALVGAPARPELVRAARQRHSGQVRHASIEGTQVYDMFTHPSMSGWAVAVAAPAAMIDRSARQASLVAAGGLAAATLAAIALAAWFARQHVRAIGRAVQAANELGNGIPPAPAHSRIVEFDALHAALHAAGEQLLQAHAYRKHAESEHQSLLEGEQKARFMAEQQNSAKDQFLAMLGHELRNPLAPISTAAQLLKLQAPDATRVRYASDVISRQVDHMNSLLGDLLDVSRVTRGLVTLNLEPVDLKVVLERALEQTAGLVTQKQHQVALDFPAGPLLVQGDNTRLIQVFANVLNNAAKYTPAGGRIRVELLAGDGQVQVAVADNGEGFSAELLPRIFDLFSQGERAPDRSQGGLGLGLALVQSLVRLHGGSVTAFSAGAGQGSRFCVTLPLAEPAGTPASPAQPATQQPARLMIMIVDDNIDGAISLSLFLEEAGGHRVSTYYDGGSALASAAGEAPDVFILDIGLPDMSGYDLARRLRAQPECAHAVFIALTGYGQPKDKDMAYAAGFDHHIAKPADPQAILALLGQVLRPA
jgi:signal transduction histidine kinase/CheY-like chemotaxis protein